MAFRGMMGRRRNQDFFGRPGRKDATAYWVLGGLAMVGSLLGTGCGVSGSYVWVKDLPASHANAPHDYRIAVGDTISIRVFNQEAMSTRARVRNDGKIQIPVVGEMEVQGKRPADLAKECEARLKEFIVNPNVNITLEEMQPINITVLGEVSRSGVVTIPSGGGVLQALANAGGLTEFASRDRIFVLRREPAQRIRFSYDDLSRGEPRASSFVLMSGDSVVVE